MRDMVTAKYANRAFRSSQTDRACRTGRSGQPTGTSRTRDPVDPVLPVTTDCAADGAICTEDGRMLSNRLVLTVTGPGQC